MVRKKTRDLLIFPQQFYTYQSLVRKNTEERDKIIHLFTGQVTLVLKPTSYLREFLVCFWLYRYRPFCKKKNRKFAVNANYLPWLRNASALRLHCDFKWHFFFILQSKLSSVSLLVSFHNQRITKWTSKIDRFCSALEANNQMNFKYTIIIINYK